MEDWLVVENKAAASRIRSVGRSPNQSKVYWIATLWVVLTNLWAGPTDILHAPPLFDDLLRLGYPPYFSTLLGVWKVLGAIVLVVPGYPLVKEWAYAGFFIDFSSAIISYAAAGDGVVSFIAPILSMAALIVSWHLRPQSRRLTGTWPLLNRHVAAGQRT
jgi:DoxX-like family